MIPCLSLSWLSSLASWMVKWSLSRYIHHIFYLLMAPPPWANVVFTITSICKENFQNYLALSPWCCKRCHRLMLSEVTWEEFERSAHQLSLEINIKMSIIWKRWNISHVISSNNSLNACLSARDIKQIGLTLSITHF